MTVDPQPTADWHEFRCAHGHKWWSAPTSARCPVCGTTTYTPLQVIHGTVMIATIRSSDV